MIYANASPAIALLLLNAKQEVLVVTRAADPGKGALDFPGGFCDGAEVAEAAIFREMQEELGLSPEHYSTPTYVCSGIDTYEFGGESIPVLSLIYTARLINDDIKITAADDAENAHFVRLLDLRPGDIYFDALQQAVIKLQEDV